MLWKLLSIAVKQQRLAAAWRRELQLAAPTLVPPRCAPLPAEGQLEVLTAVGRLSCCPPPACRSSRTHSQAERPFSALESVIKVVCSVICEIA